VHINSCQFTTAGLSA